MTELALHITRKGTRDVWIEFKVFNLNEYIIYIPGLLLLLGINGLVHSQLHRGKQPYCSVLTFIYLTGEHLEIE